MTLQPRDFMTSTPLVLPTKDRRKVRATLEPAQASRSTRPA